MNLFERITKPGEVISFETCYRGIPELNPDIKKIFSARDDGDEERLKEFEKRLENYLKDWPVSDEPCDRPGHIERVDYTTSVYEDGCVYSKYCNVYLPYGYDPADAEKKYNVIYFQHGNTGDPEFFKTPAMKLLLDRLFSEEGVDPCIVVFTTYYFDVTENVEERRSTGNVPAGDGNWPGVKPNFWREVIRNIIPAVELKYHTYLQEDTKEAIMATRDHRLFSGYSRGCVCTWYMFHNALPFFRYFIPMSCVTTAGKSIQDPPTDEEVLAYLQKPLKDHPELPFFIYAFNGGEMDVAAMNPQMNILTKAEGFSYGRDPEKNNIYFALSNYFHGDMFAPEYYYNALPVMFKGE